MAGDIGALLIWGKAELKEIVTCLRPFDSRMFAAALTWQSGPHDRISCSSQQKFVSERVAFLYSMVKNE